MAKLSEDVCTSDCEGIARAVREKKKKQQGFVLSLMPREKTKGSNSWRDGQKG